MLSPTTQQVLVHLWLELTRKSATDFGVTADIGSLEWWKAHSVGEVPASRQSICDARSITPSAPTTAKSPLPEKIRAEPELVGSV